MRHVGARPSSRVILAATGPADNDIAAHLDTEPGREVVRLHRLRIANGEIIALERAYLRHELCPGILAVNNFAKKSLYAVLKEEYRVRLVWASEDITARMPDKGEREALEMSAGVPILSMKRITYNERDEPVEYVLSCYHSERYQLRTVLRDNARSTSSGG